MWEQLALIRCLTVHAYSEGPSNIWDRQGTGQVKAIPTDGKALIFEESGYWKNCAGKNIPFRNTFKWVQDSERRISLSHLRYGPEQPVYLFTFTKITNKLWYCEVPHQCAMDQYAAEAIIRKDEIRLNWKITGPRKNENLHYCYQP
ncbi:MAG: hypothetical protein GKR95_07275 [Gammaproteobacteria bacterium]|nr:hypothetical protein [Gammaproteobacteria bacterium]